MFSLLFAVASLPFGAVLLSYLCFVLFVAIMGFYRLELTGQLNKPLRYLSMPLLAVGYVVDALVNWFVATLLFADLPKETLLTSRLQKYMAQEKDDFRKKFATKICSVLNLFDPTGKHC